jgi:hypothetical protein
MPEPTDVHIASLAASSRANSSSNAHGPVVWASGADQHYIAIRADLRGDDRDTLNPYINAYHAYVASCCNRPWSRICRIGAPIPWHLRLLNSRPRLALSGH